MADRIAAHLMTEADLARTLDRMARQIAEVLADRSDDAQGPPLALVGLQVRGLPIAQRLAARIKKLEGADVPVGVLDATMYRDDVRMRARPLTVRRTDVPFDISGRHLVLCDDVLYTGRSARAALDALLDMGRPASVRFLCIVDRGLRELPIAADFVGRHVPTLPGQEVRVRLGEVDDREGVWLVDVTADAE
jgi:pyrimidine operon attenuation protein/uracil phosphoribosyltransferase